MRRPLLLTLALVGCQPCTPSQPDEAATARAAPPIPAARYEASHVGDRFRFVSSPGGPSHFGVTARSPAGVFAVHGTDRASVTFVSFDDEGAFVADPEGRRIHPLVVEPLTPGASTTYALADGSNCELLVDETELTAEVAGVRFARCIRQKRMCTRRFSAEGPETLLTEVDLRCPDVGIVERSFDADPPLPFPNLPSEVHGRLTGFHVAGVPRMPRAGAVDRAILLPSDVAAACGLTPRGTKLEGDSTRFRVAFELPSGTLVAEGDGTRGRVADGGGCDPARIPLLEDLLASLLASNPAP